MVKTLPFVMIAALLAAGLAWGDEEPSSGAVKTVDAAARTLTLAVAGKGKTREVTIHLKPGAKVVRFTRAAGGTAGFVEQEVPLAEVKPGWIVSAVTRHDGHREVAEQVKIVFER